MKKLLLTAVALATLIINPAQAIEVTANGGFVTEYIFRGIPQTDGKAAAQGGIDIEQSGFYAGTWVSQVDGGTNVSSGLEYDLYGGYDFDVGDFSFGIGGTGYFYTDDFDETYLEVNLSAGWSFITLDYAIGTHDNDGDGDGSDDDYTFGSVTLEYNGFYGLFGAFGDDFDGDYFEVGFGDTLSVGDTELFDYSFAIIRSDEDLSGKVDGNGAPDDETFFYFGIVKNFTLYSN